MRRLALLFLAVLPAISVHGADDALPFQHKVEVYRTEDVIAFTLRLEQPFLAEEFEQSNYLRLRSEGSQAHLIYPKETKFHQKHAEFFGRLRSDEPVELTLSYETVSENIDGSRKVQVRQGKIAVQVPELPPNQESTGSAMIFKNWASKQNAHFARLLEYYPHESFFQYCLLQSQARYGVKSPALPTAMPARSDVEVDLYEFFTGSLAIHESLQRTALSAASNVGDHNTHISTLNPPRPSSLDYETLLRLGDEPRPHAMSKLIPADQYFLHFNDVRALGKALDLLTEWGDSLFRLYTVHAQDNRLQAKFEDQLCLRREPLSELFADKAIRELALTGSDLNLLEGSDLTVILDLAEPELFAKEAAGWLEETRQRRPDLQSREFNYRGHIVTAHYTNDRVVSSFSVRHENYLAYSNSHRAIRRVIDAVTNDAQPLHDALDYQYTTSLLPPSQDGNAGYFFASEAFIKQMISAEHKISQKRRLQCFNNLVMQNNASMFFRLEYGRSPNSLSELIDKRFVDPRKIICPHGGAYAFDSEHDTCTCSLHNRLRYLTPNTELSVLQVSQQEASEYQRYQQRYMAFWNRLYDPIAVRIQTEPQMKLELCVLPLANGSYYRDLRSVVDRDAQPMSTARFAPSAVVSWVAAPGREKIANILRAIPGLQEVANEDPTLTDLSWLGERMSLHVCDGETVLQLDPWELRPLDVPLVGRASTTQQAMVGALLAGANLPIYASIDVEDRDKAQRLLEQFAKRVFLRSGKLGPLATQLDGYRMPDYKQHEIYVITGRLYAVTLRLHTSLVGNQLVFATKPDVLREVIDASSQPEDAEASESHMLLQLNHRAIDQLRDSLELYWAEKSRVACHRNIVSVYNFHRLYDAPMDKIHELSEAKYGIRYRCPDHGEYSFDKETNQVTCSVHGNREHSRQNPRLDQQSSFAQFFDSIDQVNVSLRFQDEALMTTVEIRREEK